MCWNIIPQHKRTFLNKGTTNTIEFYLEQTFDVFFNHVPVSRQRGVMNQMSIMKRGGMMSEKSGSGSWFGVNFSPGKLHERHRMVEGEGEECVEGGGCNNDVMISPARLCWRSCWCKHGGRWSCASSRTQTRARRSCAGRTRGASPPSRYLRGGGIRRSEVSSSHRADYNS